MSDPRFIHAITNADTGQTEFIPFTAKEKADKEKAIKDSETERFEFEQLLAKRASALEKLKALGLTEDEIAAL